MSIRRLVAETARVSGCCDRRGYADIFGGRFSRHLARRYRRRGLDKTATRMVAFLTEQGVEGASVLEIGGGIGDLQLELLRRGAAYATNLELVDSYETDATALARDAGVADRINRRTLDLAATPDAIAQHDIVILHRVVCCYPDYRGLLTAAANHARQMMVFSYPSRNPMVRVVFAAENLAFRLRRTTFRTYLHDPDAMTAAAEHRRLQIRYRHRGPAWHIAGLTTEAAASR